MLPHQVISTVKLRGWDDVRRVNDMFAGWLFRGQREECWRLQPTLERLCGQLQPGVTIEQVERLVLQRFKERAPQTPQLCDGIPADEDALQWLALLQHHGGPTRLLDFTESAFIATFFAFAEAARGDSAVWAVHNVTGHYTLLKQWMATHPERARDPVLRYTAPSFNDVFHGRTTWDGFGASIARPLGRDGRIGAQKGLFVYALDLRHDLDEHLFGMHGLSVEAARDHAMRGFFGNIDNPRTAETLMRSPVVKIILPKSMRREALRELRGMSIRYAELFGDLDGTARALGHEVYELTADRD